MTDVNFDFDLLAEIAEAAPTAGGGNYTNYGRVFMDNLNVSTWDNDTKKFVKVPYTGGKIDNGVLEFQLHQEVEKKDGESFVKTWYIQVKENGVRVKTDWGNVVKPSAVKVFKSLGVFFKAMSGKGTYCAIEDFDTGKSRKDKSGKIDETTGETKEYPVTAPKFLQSFKNKAECDKAKELKFAKDALPAGAIPVKVVNSFKATVDALGGLDEAKAQFALEFEGYPIEDVIKAAGL